MVSEPPKEKGKEKKEKGHGKRDPCQSYLCLRKRKVEWMPTWTAGPFVWLLSPDCGWDLLVVVCHNSIQFNRI